ncbi:MAG: phosphoenolpyruvate carboxykinase (ATP) [Myxococcota bacterium]
MLPPVSQLTPEQAMFHFISGYTAKVAGTEMGVTDPEATFSPCFGGPFLVWHPARYAELLAKRIQDHGAKVWLVNTGWTGGSFGTGSRMKLAYTRAIIDAIHSGELAASEMVTDELFGFRVPQSCAGVPTGLLNPQETWADPVAYGDTARRLAGLFIENFRQYEAGVSEDVLHAGPAM